MKSLLLTLPIVALFALSGCGTPGPIYQSNLDRANQYLSNGNASAAEAELLGIQSSFELEDGSPLEQLGFHKAYADTSLQLGFLAEPVFLSRDALDPTTIAARTQAIEAARKQYREARKQFSIVQGLLPLDVDGRPREQDTIDDYDAKLGIGLTYLREGILLGEPHWRNKARDYFDEAGLAADALGGKLSQEPRLLFSRGRLFEPNGKLTRSQVQQILVEYHRFQEQQKQVGFTVHLAYRDMLDFIFSYDTPNKLAEIEGPDGALRQELASRYLDWLREYYDSGVQLPEQWDEFESKLNNFFATQQAWAEQAEKAQAIVAHARELTTGTDVSADEFVNLLEALATIKSEFRSDLYDLYYRTALQDCVEELLDEAIGNMELREFKSATDAAFRAKSYATSEVLTDEKRDNLRGRCQDIAESIRSHEAFARLDANVRRVARATGSDDALALLEKESKNRDLLTEEFSGRISALRSELTENSEAYQKAVRLLGAIAEVESRTERLTKAKELDGIVETHGLGTLKSLTKRAYRDALVDNQQYDEAITQTNQIAVLDPSDKLAIGLCNFEKKEYSEAAKLFNAVKPKVIRNSKGASYLRAAGESNLNAMHPDKGFAFFKELKSLNEELGQRDLSIDNKLIECCRLRLERSNDQKLSLDEERHWRTEWKKLDGRQYDNLRELVRANYKLGQDALRKESTSSDAMRYFEEAYTDLRSYLTKNGYGGLSIDDQKIADRLYACFADYAPLDSGTTYVYENESTGTKREERRTAGGKKDDVKVTVQVEGVKIEQRWFKISDKLIREISGTNRPLLIRIPDPEQTKYEDSWGNQRVEITDIGQKFGTYQHCLIVRVYGREAGRNDYFEYTLAPDIGIVRELRASNPSQSTYVLKSRS